MRVPAIVLALTLATTLTAGAEPRPIQQELFGAWKFMCKDENLALKFFDDVRQRIETTLASFDTMFKLSRQAPEGCVYKGVYGKVMRTMYSKEVVRPNGTLVRLYIVQIWPDEAMKKGVLEHETVILDEDLPDKES